MATVKDRYQSAFLRPKTARFSDVQPRLSPFTNRRHTVAGAKSHSAPTPSSKSKRTPGRIQKTSFGRRSTPVEPSLADQFTDRLLDYRNQIQKDVDKSLDGIHMDHANQVEALSAQFEEQLSLMHESEQPLHASLAGEILRIPMPPPQAEQDQEEKFEEVNLHKRVKAFQKLVNEKHQAINKLINQWNANQIDIIALAAEILGPDKLLIDKGKSKENQPDFEKALSISKNNQDKAEEKFQDILAEISKLEQQATELTAQTKETMDKQQKERSLAQQKTLKEMNRMAKQLQEEEE